MSDPVDGRVCGAKPRESEDDILSATAHDIEEMFLGDPFDICIEGAHIVDHTGLVYSLVHISDCDGRGEFFSGESMFSDKLPVNAGDVGTRVY